MKPRQNPAGENQATAERRAGVAVATAAAVTTAPAGSGGMLAAGSNDPITGDWRPAGITNITSTGDPFYSAKG